MDWKCFNEMLFPMGLFFASVIYGQRKNIFVDISIISCTAIPNNASFRGACDNSFSASINNSTN